MQGTCLRFYVQENRTHHRVLIYEWLLEQARRLGIQGGSAFKALAGFGRHGMLHEDHFFELAGQLPVVVEFVLSEEEAERFLTFVRTEELTVLFTKSALEFGWIKGVKS
jgi:PII-like signaling protein